MLSLYRKIFFLQLPFFLLGCDPNLMPIEINSDIYHDAVDRMTDTMVEDIFSPPVASRVYAYSNIAAHEILARNSEGLKSYTEIYEDLAPIPEPPTTEYINYRMAALIANLEVGKKLVFSEHLIEEYQDSLYQNWESQNKNIFRNSLSYGIRVAEHILNWVEGDGYTETRNMPKHYANSKDPSRWQPTPPAYMDGIEPHWAKIRPFTLDSASQFMPKPHPQFSMKKNSPFYKELLEVYQIAIHMEEQAIDSEELHIARFWDCNPYVSNQRGHLNFATKKITPGGHWIGICKIASQKTKLDFEQSVSAYSATSIAIADAFISCWDEKYRSELIRPETLINRYIDFEWRPILQTPPFPEYPSGHSVVSGAAATVLTQLFGQKFAYEDATEVKYGLPIRHFSSFDEAAQEAALSRLYGGIHYRSAIEGGLDQGRNLGKNVVNKLQLKMFNLE